jgi:branched-chain amino acid transport system substrate-binding protein
MYCLSASYTPPIDQGLFSYGITTENVIRVNLAYFRTHGMKRVAAIFPTDATGQDGERATRAAMDLPENSAVQLVDVEHFNGADVSVTAQMSKIKAAAPDVLIAYVSGTPMGTVLQSAKSIGLDVPVVTSGANYNLKQMDQFAPILPEHGLFIAAVPGFAPSAVPEGPAKRAINAYLDARKRYCSGCGVQTIIGWDSGSIVVAALRAVGAGATGPQIAAYIANLHDYYGACGEYDFRRNPHGLDGNTAVIVRYDRAKHDFVPMTRLASSR